MKEKKTKQRHPDAKPLYDFTSTVLLACPHLEQQLAEVMKKIHNERRARQERWLVETAAEIVRDNPKINTRVARYAVRHSTRKSTAIEKSHKIMAMFKEINE